MRTMPTDTEMYGALVERAPTRRLTDTDLRAMSIDPAGARRYFKDRYGMTFHAYHRARRMGLALAEVRTAGSGPAEVDAVGLRHGFRSASGFRDAFGRLFGEPPGRGEHTRCLHAKWLDTPLGPMLAVAGDEGLMLLEFVDRRRVESEILALRTRTREVIVPGTCEHLERIADELAAYFSGTLRRFDVTLDVAGTPFQRLVWNRLRRIPHGETLSYGRLAEEIGRPGGQRAVGLANGRNCLAIVVPCHRVILANGSLGGYGGGRWRKQWLLDLEQNGPPDSLLRGLTTASMPPEAATERSNQPQAADRGTRARRPAGR